MKWSRVVIASFMLVTLLLLVLQGHPYNAKATASTESTNTTYKQSAADVSWAYMSWPIHSQYVSDPLIGSRDQDKIAELLQWLDYAKANDGKGLTSPMMGRSMALHIEYRDHNILTIRPAWHCTSKQDEQGNTTTSCTPVENKIWVSDPVKGDYFVESDKLFSFVSEGYSDWLPNVLPYELPAELKPGTTFTVVGHGARTDKVNVTLAKEDKIIWEQSIAVYEGEWQGKGEVPADLPEGEYDWKVQIGDSGYGTSVHIVD
ncbi:hypothetical protein [Paenibacillus glycanilyticus]|uniref:Uncharacterized protein n=1 Tax=Paenibacillus glycanilyticus TaxID=126569 RepID=A0ABQ6G9Q3_9BACL|nr:hypothetical protein [Paenibacillus glycanilyticus]GLX65797.1 hypothetical protein MU1_01410 [Paenibacillus glycanilyticus]